MAIYLVVKLNNMTIKNLTITQKITILGSTIAICVAALIGLTSLYSSEDIIERRMIESELPSKLHSISNQIGGEINELLGAAQQLSSNEFILAIVLSDANLLSITKISSFQLVPEYILHSSVPM